MAAATLVVFAPGSTAPAEAAGSRSPLGQFIWWNDEGSGFASFGANSAVILNTIKFGFVTTCPEGGIGDTFFGFADVYIVPAGSALADGATLTDVTSTPNTVGPASSAGSLDELIGTTGPVGKLGNGMYAIVIDECQDGKLDPHDAIFDPAFAVQYDPANVPDVVPAFEHMKDVAGAQGASWLQLQRIVAAVEAVQQAKAAIECLKALGDCAVGYLIDKMTEAVKEKLMEAFGVVDPVEAAKLFVNNTIQHYLRIKADPPDPAFQQLDAFSAVSLLTSPQTDPLLTAAIEIGNAAANEGAVAEALLRAIERYQGADAADDGDWALSHARSVQHFADVLAEQLATSKEALTALDAAVTADPEDWDALAPQLEGLRSGLADGFTLAERQFLRNRGLTEEQVADLEDDIAATSYADLSESAAHSAIAAQIVSTDATIAALATLETNMASIISALQAEPLVLDTAPHADAGGPYSGSEGTALALDGAGSTATSGRTIATYAWDLDQDGQFDDASGATPSHSPGSDFDGTVGLRVTDSAGESAIAYAPISIASVNSAPTITAFAPTDLQPEISLGDSESFSVTASDPDGDAITVEWFVDGVAAGYGLAFSYTPAVAGAHLVSAVASDGPAGGSDTQEWMVSVLAVDADSDGWNANVDCMDSDPAIPGEFELVGNGKDDDCDVSTPDEGSAPVADFSHSVATGLVTSFVDRSTDANDDIVDWHWDFGDGGTSDEQSPIHTYAVKGPRTVTLTVEDQTGRTHTVTRTVSISAAPTSDFTYVPPSPVGGGEVEFSDASEDSDGEIVGWAWMFGDGGTSSLQNPTHVYLGPGTFTVTLTVTDDDGLTATSSQEVVVGIADPGTAPVALFRPDVPARDLAATANGGTVVASSGFCCGGHEPFQMLDDNVGLPWATAGVVGHFATIQVSPGTARLIQSVQIQPRSDCCFDQRVKNFAIDVSTTGTAAADFTQVLSTTAANNGTLQTFALPPGTSAKYVRYRPLNAQTSTGNISTSKFKVISQQSGARRVTFLNQSLNAVTYRWTFGDGSAFSTEMSPTHIYAAIGIYTVTLVARAADGRTSTIVQAYEARGPTASFDVDPTAPIPGEAALHDDTSGFPTSAGKSWAWSFGDGSTSTAANVPHAYAAANSYVVTLTVTDTEGLSDTATRTVTVADDPAARPRALFNPSSRGQNVALAELGGTVHSFSSQFSTSFPATTTIDADASTHWKTANLTPTNSWIKIDLVGTRAWAIDRIRLRGNTSLERVKDFKVFVSTTGTADADFTEVLSAQNPNSNVLTEHLLAAPVKARYVMIRGLNNWGHTCCIAMQEIRILTGSDAQSGRNLGLAETGATIHSFSGQFSASFPASTLIDAPAANSYWASPSGQTSSWIKIDLAGNEPRQLDVLRLAPANSTERVRDFEVLVSDTGTADADFTLVHAATAPNSDTGYDYVLEHPRPAKYVLLRFLNNRGHTCCVAAYQAKTFTGQETARNTVRFDNLSSRADSYAWDFGDGTTSTVAEPTHTFPGPGTYDVTLTATNANGSTTYELDQVVRAAEISFTPPAPEAQQQIDFRDASPPELGLTAWSWNLGDGTTSTFQHPVKTYAAAGTYTVTLTATDVEGNTHLATESVTIAAPSFRAQFHPRGGLNMAALENGAAVTSFSSQYDASTFKASNLLDAYTSTSWASGNGSPTNKVIKFSLASGQTYQLDRFQLLGRLDAQDQSVRDFEIAVSTTGTADADFKTVLRATLPANTTTLQTYMLPRPVLAKYVLYRGLNNRGSACCVSTSMLKAISGQVSSATVTFDDLTVGGVAPLSYAWSFGDGGTSNEASPTHTYAGPGTYPVTLTVTDGTGATSTYSLPQRVIAAPVVSFTNSPAAPNENQSTSFTDTTPAPAGGPLVERRWSWADGTANTVLTAAGTTHTFLDNGAYGVRLEVLDAWGQTASLTRTINVANVAPTVEAGPSWRWREDRALTATPTTTDVAGTRDPITCTWTYGDSSAAGTGCPFNHTYANTGTYTATITANDGDGGTATDSFTVEVIEQEVTGGGGGGGSGSGGGTGVGKTSKDYVYTVDGDFELGTLLNVNHEAPGSDQLQLNKQAKPFPFVYIAISGRDTAVRVDVDTGTILGEYLTAPVNRSGNPSRTTVDKLGNVWVTNRNEGSTTLIDGVSMPAGSTTRIGLIVGGTRSNADGTPNPTGEYLKAPFEYNTCVDKNSDGLIRTSRGLTNILPWPNTSGVDHDGGVETAVDECIQFYVRVRGINTRTVAIDADNDAWIGGLNSAHEKVDGETGQRVPGTAFDLNCGGYGGLIDGNGILWSARYGGGLLRYNTNTKTGVCLGNSHGDYGLGVDPVTGHIWHTNLGGNRVVKLNPAATTAATIEIARYPHGSENAQGVAVDSKANVWVSHALFGAPTIGRVRTDGVFLGTPSLGPGAAGSTGVAVDANGKVWSANYATSNASRIDPEIGQKIAGTVPSGWYDMVVSLGSGASPYNYSDMTGAVAIGAASPSGFWSIQQDATALGTIWKRISWDGSTPPGTSITVEARAADTQAALTSTPFVTAVDGVLLSGVVGRFIEVRATLQTTDSTTTPILTDIRISANTPPVASNGTAETNKNEAKEITLVATDNDGDTLTYELVDAAAHGAVSLAGNIATYTPAVGYTGPDSFTFKARDGTADSNVATVSLTVLETNEPPVAPDVNVSTLEDTPLPVALPATDPDLDTLTITYTQPANGSFDGTTYVPDANYFGPDSFTYTATDPDGESDSGVVSINVVSVNDPPSVAQRNVATDEDTPLPIALAGTDADGDALTITTTDPSHGTYAGGVYTPAANYHGPDSFQYTADDGNGGVATATVSILVRPVNDAPNVDDRGVETDEDTPLAIELGGSDVDGDALSITTTDPSQGTFIGGIYTPAPNYHGPDSFQYTADDGNGGTDTATVSITVRPVNDAPVAGDQDVETDEDRPLAIALGADDVDGDPLTFALASGPQHGTWNGTVYTPEANYHGPDSFEFLVSDGNGGSDTGTVTITVHPVNDPPVADDRAVATDEDTPLAIDLTGSDVDGDALTFALASPPSHGAFDSGVYLPDLNYFGPDSFTFLVSDGNGGTDLGTITIDVRPVNDPPVAESLTLETDEDTPLPITFSAFDVEGDTITFTLASNPSHGTFAGGVYTPAPNYFGPDVFAFLADDGNGGTDIEVVQITVRPVNDAPVVEDRSLDTDEDTPLAITFSGTDVENDALTFTTTAPSHGTFAGGVYTPAPNYHGPDSFEYTADDGNGATDTATVTITVRPVNDPPVADDQSVATDEDTPLAITLGASDIDGDALTYAVATAPQHGTWDGTTYTPAANYNGPDSFVFLVSDGNGGTDVGLVSITVQPVNDSPNVDDRAVETDEDTPLTIDLTGTDVDGDALSITATAPSHGSYAGGVYTPAPNYHGPDSFEYTADDGHGGTDTATVSITVRPVNDAPVVDDRSVSTDEDTAIAIDLTGTDVDGDALAITTTAPSHGTFAGGVYTPAPNYHGPDSFEYTADDGNGGTDTATVSITVRPVNEAPVVRLVAPTSTDEASAPVTLEAIASDPDGDTGLTYTWSAATGTVTPAGATAGYTNDDGLRIDTVTVTVSDGSLSTSASAEIEVRNLPPTANAGADKTGFWGLPLVFAGTATDPSNADTAAGFIGSWSFADGTLPVAGMSVGHTFSQPGSYTATLTASDKDGGSDTDEAAVTIEKRPTALGYTGPTTGTGAPQTLTARLTDTVDTPSADLAGKTIVFTLGALTVSGVTDAAGLASATATLPTAGGTLSVFFDGDDRYLPSSSTAEIGAGGGPGKVTGGGLRASGSNGRGGFNVQSTADGAKGELQWQKTGLTFHAHTLLSLLVSTDGRSAWFTGVGVDGRGFTAYVEDNGEPGRNDVFMLWIDGRLQSAPNGTLVGGNIQIHE